MKGKKDIFDLLELAGELFGKEGLCQLNDKDKVDFFLKNLLEWRKRFFYHRTAVMKALKTLKETSIKAFLIDLYQDVSEYDKEYPNNRKELFCLWISLSPEELGFNESADKLNDPQHDSFIITLYETGLKLLSEVIYDKEAIEMSKVYMRKFIANGATEGIEISSQDEETINKLFLTEKTFEETFNLLNSMRIRYIK